MYSDSYIPTGNLAFIFIILRISINIVAISSLFLVKSTLQSHPDILYFNIFRNRIKIAFIFLPLMSTLSQLHHCISSISPVSTTIHRCQQRLTGVNNNSPVSTTTHRCQQQLTGVNNDSPVSTTTHRCQQRLTGVNDDLPVSLFW